MSYEMWDTLEKIKKENCLVDLTHCFGEKTPRFEGFDPMSCNTVFEFNCSPVKVQEFKMVGQYGTHVDAPAHARKGARSLHEITIKEMMYPLCVIDVHDKVNKNVDYALNVEDILLFEKRYGKIPQGAFVAMRSDWSLRWPDQNKIYNKDADGICHYPGWDIESVKFLLEQRKIGAIGHETPDTDPPAKKDQILYLAEVYLLKADKIQIEFMTNLNQVPPAGAVIVCSFPKVENATGFPARCFAICPSK